MTVEPVTTRRGRRAPARFDRGDVRVLAVDGPAGFRKTTAAQRLARDLWDAPLVHLDDLLEGRSGSLAAVWQRLRTPRQVDPGQKS